MANSWCPRCGEPVQDWSKYCTRCGWKLSPPAPTSPPFQEAQYPRPDYKGQYPPPPYYRSWVKEKDTGVAVILAVLCGLIGFMGIGHFYVGKIARGIFLLIFGLVVGPTFTAVVLYLVVSGWNYFDGTIFIPFIVLTVVWLIVLIWQAFDAYELTKEYNHAIRTTGAPPW